MERGRIEVDLTALLYVPLLPPEKAMKVKSEGDMK